LKMILTIKPDLVMGMVNIGVCLPSSSVGRFCPVLAHSLKTDL
jgi:hypothetical protein